MKSPTDPSIPPGSDRSAASNPPAAMDSPTAGAGPVPPVITNPPAGKAGKSASFQNFVAVCLSLCLGLFLIAGAVSFLDDSLVLLWGQHWFTLASEVLAFMTFCLLLLIYGLMGITPVIPKRVFLPVIIFSGLGLMAVFPTLIYGYNHILHLDWLLSFLQVSIVLMICRRLLSGGRFRWSVVEARHLGSRAFSWRNLSGFLLLNVFVLAPALVAYLAFTASLALSHFTDGFLTLRPGGLILQARKYVREDGKTIVLFPMSHIAETDFYQAMAHSVSSNSIVLMEGVTDEHNLLAHRLSYKRAAKALGLAEQHEDLNIRQGELVRADVDVAEFSSNSIAVLNLISLMHTQGLNAGTVSQFLLFQPTPEFQQQLFVDLLMKRNEHLLKELRTRLRDSNDFVIPWGAAHMPGLAAAIQASGFRVVETHDYVSIRFWPKESQGSRPGKGQSLGNSQ